MQHMNTAIRNAFVESVKVNHPYAIGKLVRRSILGAAGTRTAYMRRG